MQKRQPHDRKEISNLFIYGSKGLVLALFSDDAFGEFDCAEHDLANMIRHIHWVICTRNPWLLHLFTATVSFDVAVICPSVCAHLDHLLLQAQVNLDY